MANFMKSIKVDIKRGKDVPKCSICGKEFIPVEDSIEKKITGYIFKGDCEHFPKNIRISIG